MRNHTEPSWQQALKIGVAGGGAAVLLSMIGMVEAFAARGVISGLVSLGQVLLLTTILASAYFAARRAQTQGASVLAAGALAGAAVGAMLALLVVFGSLVDLRRVFINASPGLYNILTFGQGPYLGALVLVVVGAVVGVLGGGLLLLSPAVRSTVLSALGTVVMVGLLSDLLLLIIAGWGQIGGLFRWLFTGKALSIAGVLVIGGLVVLFSVLRQRGIINVRPPVDPGSARRGQIDWKRQGVFLVILLLLPPVLGSYMSEVLDQVGLFVLMGLGLNIVVGFAGLLDLGYVAFYAIGAYVMAMLTSPELGFANLSWWAAMPIAVGVAILFGVILGIPVLKVRGDYLAIITLGFGEIIRLLAISDALRGITGGAQGVLGIAKPTIGSFVFDDQVKIYYLLLAGCLLAAFISLRLRDSRMGRAWMAMREDEDVAQAIGINLVTTKLLAFAAGAAFSGLSGAIFAAKLGSIYPHSFGLLISINVLALIIVGGMGSIPGVVVGALALVGLPELLREFAEFRLLVYGVVLVVMMLYRPEGLWPEATHMRELHADDAEPAADATGQATGEAQIEVKAAG
jgi:branched-chain amino acid transport system permease protein